MFDTANNKYYLFTFISWGSGASGGEVTYQREEITDICDGCIHFTDGTKFCTGTLPPPAPTPINVANLYVDGTFGSDATGLPNRFDRPWKSIEGALANAVAGTPTLIYVRRGSYAPPTLIFKNLVDFYFEPGTTMIAGGFADGGNAVRCSVYGGLSVNGFVGVLNISGGSTIYFEFDKINTTFFGFAVATTIASSVSIKGNRIDATPTPGFNFLCTFRGITNVWMDIKDYIISDRELFFFRQTGASQFTGTAYINCPRMVMRGDVTVTGEKKLTTMNAPLTPVASTVNIVGDLYMTGTAPFGILNLENTCVSMRAGTLNIKGNIFAGAFQCLQTDGALGGAGGLFHLTGSMSSSRECIRQSHALLQVLIEQGLLITSGTGSIYPYAIVHGVGYAGLPAQPANILFVKDCRLYNSLVDGNIANISLNALGNNIYTYDCDAASAGALGEFITTLVPVTSGFKSTTSNKPNNILVTNVFAPSGFITDPGFLIPLFP
jgi:hypothetical protein